MFPLENQLISIEYLYVFDLTISELNCLLFYQSVLVCVFLVYVVKILQKTGQSRRRLATHHGVTDCSPQVLCRTPYILCF